MPEAGPPRSKFDEQDGDRHGLQFVFGLPGSRSLSMKAEDTADAIRTRHRARIAFATACPDAGLDTALLRRRI